MLRAIPVTTLEQVEQMRLLRNATAAGYANYNEQISEAKQVTWWEANRERVQAWLYGVDGPSDAERYRHDGQFDQPIIYYSTIVGFGLLRRDDEGRWWTTVGVDPAHTGLNYGRQITTDLVIRAPGQVYGSARRDNPAAVKLHVAADWEPIEGPDKRLAYFRTRKADRWPPDGAVEQWETTGWVTA